MSYEIRYSETFKRSVKTLAKKYPSLKKDLADFIIELSEHPEMGTSLGNNMYKVRMTITSKAEVNPGAQELLPVLFINENKYF